MPTLRNDNAFTVKVEDINKVWIDVLPGASIQTYYNAISGFTKTSDSPYHNRRTADPVEVPLTSAAAANLASAASKANPCELTVVSHGYTTDDYVYCSGVVGMTELNDKIFKVTKEAGEDTISLQGIDSTDYTTYQSGGSLNKVVPVEVSLDGDTKKLFLVRISDGKVRVYYDAILNEPHIVDVDSSYEWEDSSSDPCYVGQRVGKLVLVEIGGGTSVTVTILQEK